MKRIFTLIFAVIVIHAFSQTSNPAPYCASEFSSSSSYPELSKVELSTLVNTSVHTPSPGYTFYDNLSPVALNASGSYLLKLTLKNVDMETMIKAWIDFNLDSVFTPDELIMNVPQGSVGTGMSVVQQNTFSVPANVNTITTRMRISLGWHYSNWTTSTFLLDSCHTMVAMDGSAGETEDYPVNMVNTTGTTEYSMPGGVSVFPNPASETLHVILSEHGNFKDIILFDATGREIKRASSSEVDVSGLEHGIYLLEIVSGENSVVRKVMIE